MKLIYIYILLFSLFAIAACQKEENKRFSYHNGIEASKSFVQAEQMMVQLLNTYFKSLTDSTLINTGSAYIDGAEVILTYEPMQILIKYPEWGVFDGYGHRRGGNIIASTETSFLEPESTIEFDFVNFQYDWDTLRIDSMHIYNAGLNNNQDYVFDVVATDVSLIDYDSLGTLYFDMNQQFVSSDNDSTNPYKFDRFLITGELNGTSYNLVDFSSIVNDGSLLIYGPDCVWLSGGVVNVDIERFIYPAEILFAAPDSCGNQYLILMNDDPFPFRIDSPDE